MSNRHSKLTCVLSWIPGPLWCSFHCLHYLNKWLFNSVLPLPKLKKNEAILFCFIFHQHWVYFQNISRIWPSLSTSSDTNLIKAATKQTRWLTSFFLMFFSPMSACINLWKCSVESCNSWIKCLNDFMSYSESTPKSLHWIPCLSTSATLASLLLGNTHLSWDICYWLCL